LAPPRLPSPRPSAGLGAAALTGRRIATAGIPPLLSVGLGSLASALLLGEPLDAPTLGV